MYAEQVIVNQCRGCGRSPVWVGTNYCKGCLQFRKWTARPMIKIRSPYAEWP